MPSQQEVKWSQLKVGIIVLASVGLLSTLLFLMSSASGMSVFSRKIIVKTYVSDANGVKTGAPVSLEGITIGEVTKVFLTTDPERKATPVEIIMKLDPKFHESMHEDSTASLSTVGVLGDAMVNINSTGAHGPELKSGDELQTKPNPSITEVVQKSEQTLESVNEVLLKMDTLVGRINKGDGSVGKLLNDPALFDKATRTLDDLHQLAENLNNGKGSAGKLLNNDELYNHLNAAAGRLDEISKDLDAGKGTAGKLLKDDKLYNNADSTLAHANSLLAEADAGKGSLGMLSKDPAFAQKLNDTVTQLNALLTGVNDGKGTLGKLAKDDAAYDNMNKLLAASTDLVTTIRQDPKKYLSIHMKIF